MNLIFLGPPGCGKGTQAKMLAKKLNINQVSTGDLLREEVSLQTDLGREVTSFISSGGLVPDYIVIDIIKKRLQERCSNGFIFDGFPRNVEQAKELDKILISIKKKIDAVFDLHVPKEVLIKRILGRFSCKSCGEIYNNYFKASKISGICDKCNSKDFESRGDDNEEVIKKRLQVYSDSTSKLTDYYKKNDLLVTINAAKSPPLIFEELLDTINKLHT